MRAEKKKDGPCRVAMAGRSVMGHWFKFWNFPDLLSRYAIYVPWPIPYERHEKNGFRFHYVRIDPPDPGAAPARYGEETLASLRRQVEGKGYDALFFKLCFVDFRDRKLNSESEKKHLFEGMRSLIGNVHAFARGEKSKLLIGNALPVLRPGEYAQQLRREYNEWIGEYALRNPDTIVFDFFGMLSNENGLLRREMARNAFDSHLNREAYAILDTALLSRLSALLPTALRG